MIDVLYYLDDITVMFSLFPILTGKYSGEFRLFLDPERLLKSRNKSVVLFRMYKRKREGFNVDGFIEKLRQQGKRIAYFDDTADPREIEPAMISSCDVYFKKQILKDMGSYKRPVYGRRMISEHYHEKHGIIDDDNAWADPISQADLEKLRLSWNLGIGTYPKSRIKKAISMRLAGVGLTSFLKYVFANPTNYRHELSKVPMVSARFGRGFTRNTISEHRKLFIAETAKRPDLFFSGRVPLKEYNRELRTVAVTVSPFGWGEICFRDFEAIINRSLLMKPSMDHITTWPDIYRPDETYISLDWDAKDLIAKTEAVLLDQNTRMKLTENAYAAYADALAATDERVSLLINELEG